MIIVSKNSKDNPTKKTSKFLLSYIFWRDKIKIHDFRRCHINEYDHTVKVKVTYTVQVMVTVTFTVTVTLLKKR